MQAALLPCRQCRHVPVSIRRRSVPFLSRVVRGRLSPEESLLRRRSVREFGDRALTPPEIFRLLWAAQGISDPREFRAAPSAGALYPLEVYVAVRDGVLHYDPPAHALDLAREGDLRQDLCSAALGLDAVREAALTLVVMAVYSGTEVRYGPTRSHRYVHLEAGHAAQNVLLQAAALGLGAVPIGAFDDSRVQTVLGLPNDHMPLYLIPIGHPR